jgi:hypothetical protein
MMAIFAMKDRHLGYIKKFLKKKTLVGISFMQIAPDSSWTQILWNGHFFFKTLPGCFSF